MHPDSQLRYTKSETEGELMIELHTEDALQVVYMLFYEVPH